MKNFINELGLIAISALGPQYTWENKGDPSDFTFEKLVSIDIEEGMVPADDVNKLCCMISLCVLKG